MLKNLTFRLVFTTYYSTFHRLCFSARSVYECKNVRKREEKNERKKARKNIFNGVPA